MDHELWGNAWSEPQKIPIADNKADEWTPEPQSQTLNVTGVTSWESQWKESTSGWHAETFSAPEASWATSDHSEHTLERASPPDTPRQQTPPIDNDLTQIDNLENDTSHTLEDLPSKFSIKDTEIVPFGGEVSSDWNALGNAAVSVGDEASWNTAWVPPATEDVEGHTSDQEIDEWDQAIQARNRRDEKIVSVGN